MFYKYEDGILMCGPTVAFPSGEVLHLETINEHTFPVYDWYYFATEEEAKSFYNIVDENND